MKNEVRAAVAYVAGRLVSGKESSSVFGFADKEYTALGGVLSPASVNVFDYTHGCHFSGGGDGRTFVLLHSGVNNHVSLSVQGDRFSGYDHDSGRPFSGMVRRYLIRIYDPELNRVFSYSI